jgi:dipeptidase E
MKLLLTSDGLTSRKIRKEFLKLLNKPLSENKVLIMHTAKLRRRLYRVNALKKGLIKLGIKRQNITEADISTKINARKYVNFDVFYSCGGNTFYILDRIRKTGFNKIINNFIKKNGVYVGVSAGSVIVHKTIEIAGWGREGDKNEINLKNLKGLGVTNIAIFPHFKKRLAKEVAEFKKKVNYPVKIIRDRQAIMIKGRTVRMIK